MIEWKIPVNIMGSTTIVRLRFSYVWKKEKKNQWVAISSAKKQKDVET